MAHDANIIIPSAGGKSLAPKLYVHVFVSAGAIKTHPAVGREWIGEIELRALDINAGRPTVDHLTDIARLLAQQVVEILRGNKDRRPEVIS